MSFTKFYVSRPYTLAGNLLRSSTGPIPRIRQKTPRVDLFRSFTALSITKNCSTTRAFSTKLPETAKESKEENSEEKKTNGIPWGFMFTISLILGLGGWFYRSYKNGKLLEKLKEDLKAAMTLSPDEVEDLREANKITSEIFKQLVETLKKTYPANEALPKEFFDACSEILEKELGQEEGIKAAHLIERLYMFLSDYYGNKPVSLDLLFIALTILLDTSIEERIERIFDLYAQNGEISLSDVEKIVENLRMSFQLPVRVLTKEEKHYPLNLYSSAESELVVKRAIEETVKARKKAKILSEEFKEKAENYAKKFKNNTESGESFDSEIRIDLQDFDDILMTRALCAWGECN